MPDEFAASRSSASPNALVRPTRKLLILSALVAASKLAWAGAPYFTDDPEPVEYKHYEVYLASQYLHSPGDSSGTVFDAELNYGILPNVQLHVLAPISFDAPSGQGVQAGLGDAELGIKYRFIDETADHPQVAVYPAIDFPTGDRSRGLGPGRAQLYLPAWLQKSKGPWTTYGGGGYWVNPGAGNRNWWFVGWMVQRQVLPSLAIGVEVFHETAKTLGGESDTKANLGMTWDLSATSHVLASAGPVLTGPSGYQAYLGVQFTPGAGK